MIANAEAECVYGALGDSDTRYHAFANGLARTIWTYLCAAVLLCL
jgi:hypothetical protein